MTETLVQEYGYEPYGQKHFENLLTKFLEGYWLPTRFGYDIRKAQLSSLVITGQISRDEAMKILADPPLSDQECKDLHREVADRLSITEEELKAFHEMEMPDVKYKSQDFLYTMGIKLFTFFKVEKRIRK